MSTNQTLRNCGEQPTNFSFHQSLNQQPFFFLWLLLTVIHLSLFTVIHLTKTCLPQMFCFFLDSRLHISQTDSLVQQHQRDHHKYISEIQIEIQMKFFQVCAWTGWMGWPPSNAISLLSRPLSYQLPNLLSSKFLGTTKLHHET